jgi:molecular chaperone DnaK
MYTVGIDLGTTNTVAAANAGVLPLATQAAPSAILPSIVAYLPGGDVLVGHAARERRAIDVKNTLYSAKRVIGQTWHSYNAREFCGHYPFDTVRTAEDQVGFRTRAGVVTADDVAVEVLRALCTETGVDPSELSAVVSVPASFDSAPRMATLRAALRAGFARARLVPEPVATALAYLDRNDLRYAAVYDLGGGTFDFAVIDCSAQPLRVAAHGGDGYLGGDDVDRRIAEYAADTVLRSHGWDLRTDREVLTRLTMEAERAKLRLSRVAATTIELGGIDLAGPSDLAPVPIDRKVLWDLSAELIGRTFAICDEVMGRAGVSTRDIQAVFLAGGCTLLPGVRHAVAEYFGGKVRSELDPMHVVALGASIASARPRLATLLSTD